MVFAFADCELDVERVELRRAGRLVEVRPQVFDVIEHLVRHHERVVGRDELLDEVWGDRFVGASTVATCIKHCRRALGDDGATQRLIRTVQGRGYRLVAEVAEVAERGAPSPDERAIVATAGPAGPAPSGSTHASPPGERPRSAWPMVGRSIQVERALGALGDAEVVGVRVVGDDGVGTTAFADRCAEVAHDLATAVHVVHGSRSAADIALAAVRPLVGDDVPPPTGSGDVARSSAFAAALAAASSRLGERRALIVVHGADHLDGYSRSLLRQLLADGRAVALVPERPGSGAASLLDGSLGRVVEVRLEPLGERDVDALLYRALPGPVDAVTLRTLVELSGGRPKVLRDVVESSLAAGSLRCEDDVWSLVGPPASSGGAELPDDLGGAARRGLEVLALAGALPLADATALLGEAALDELDGRRLVALRDEVAGPIVALADPLLAPHVVRTIGPLRARRLRAELAAELLAPGHAPAAVAAVIGWADEAGVAVDVGRVTAAAQAALASADLATAARLVEHAPDDADPALALVRGELWLQRNQWARAEDALTSIDVDRLDDTSAAHVLRRLATIRFYRHGDHDGSIDDLADEARRRDGGVARALRARRMGMLAYVGRAADVLDADAELGEPRGVAAIEVAMSAATARLHRGELEEALALAVDVARHVDRLPPVFAAEPQDGLLALRISALLSLGRIDEAAERWRAALPMGGRTHLGYLPSIAARVELAAGRPRAAREVLRQAIATSNRERFPHYVTVGEALGALADLAVGERARAAEGLDRTVAGMAALTGELAWQVAVAATELAAGLGADVELPSLVALAADARGVGAPAREADLLLAAVLDDPATWTAVGPRLTDLATGLPGSWWPIALDHARALGEGRPLDEVAARYAGLGYHGHARAAADFGASVTDR